jgi:hypothetical protein
VLKVAGKRPKTSHTRKLVVGITQAKSHSRKKGKVRVVHPHPRHVNSVIQPSREQGRFSGHTFRQEKVVLGFVQLQQRSVEIARLYSA